MRADSRFLRQPKSFWANVRSISQQVNYTDRATGQITVPTPDEVAAALRALGLASSHLLAAGGALTESGQSLFAYFRHRADVLNDIVRHQLMNAAQAKALFDQLSAQLRPSCPIPMNKQAGEKRAPAYLTGIVNMLIEAGAEGLPCDYNPGRLTTITRHGAPLRTMARRVDGAFPSTVNPIAVWEIKEYYYTTTFGSRVADGVYETLLDGLELEELREHEGVDVKHYLMVDGSYTWWDSGRSYLCRIIDMLHMGYVDEVFFGREVAQALPTTVKEWVGIARSRPASSR